MGDLIDNETVNKITKGLKGSKPHHETDPWQL